MNRIVRNERRSVGLDVHVETTTVAIATKDGDVRTMGGICNRPESVKRLVAKIDAGRLQSGTDGICIAMAVGQAGESLLRSGSVHAIASALRGDGRDLSPQGKWILDAIDERMMPLSGHAVGTDQSIAEMLRCSDWAYKPI